MSRVGKQIITLPEKVTFKQSGRTVTITGPLGNLSRDFDPTITIQAEGNTLQLKPTRHSIEIDALWGTYGSHLKNMILGVTKGFEKKMEIEGVGYRAAVASTKLTLNLGLSHPVELAIPPGLKITVDKNLLTVSGIDKELVGQTAATIRGLKPPEPYKGKGIHYLGEIIRRKEGKRVVA